MKSFQNAAVEKTFKQYPPTMRRKLLKLRSLIFKTAAGLGVGDIEETLKWGEPAYLPVRPKIGSAVRIAWKKSHPAQYAMYFLCQTSLIDTFRTLFPTQLRYEGNRAIVFDESDEVPDDILSFCIAASLTYHLRKDSVKALGYTDHKTADASNS